ncbi:MAG: hypothetical protein ACOVQ7_08220, partial [Limnoraphis robusta]
RYLRSSPRLSVYGITRKSAEKVETSLIIRQLRQLKHYQMEVEICLSTSYRLYSQWTGKYSVEGELLND